MAEEGAPGIEDPAAVRAALAEITAWVPMRRSPLLSAFLTHIVEAVLRGDEASIKAYAIAVDVFGRGEDFDPQADPIVRVQARRLRALLEEFDRSEVGTAPVRIVVPIGTYVPQFLQRTPAAEPGAGELQDAAPRLPQAPSLSIWVAGAIAALILLASLYFWPELAQRTDAASGGQPQTPLLVVEAFEDLLDDAKSDGFVSGLAVELVTTFNLFPDLSARYGGTRAEVTQDDLDRTETVYILSGVVRPSQNGITYSVVVRDSLVEAVLANYDVELPVPGETGDRTIQEVARQLALRIGSPRSQLHRPARAWLGTEAAQGVVLDRYPCLVAFAMYREVRLDTDPARIEACARAGSERDDAELTAVLASIQADSAWRIGVDTPESRQVLEDAAELAERAAEAEPLSAFVWAQRGFVSYNAGDVDRAREFYNTALQLNPAAVDMVADYAYLEALAGDWASANRLAELALSVEADAPQYYYLVPALWALREGEYHRAIAYAERMIDDTPYIGPAILVAAGGHLDDAQIINAYLPRLLALPRYRRVGIMPALRYHMADTQLLHELLTGMLEAGVPLDRLVEPF